MKKIAYYLIVMSIAIMIPKNSKSLGDFAKKAFQQFTGDKTQQPEICAQIQDYLSQISKAQQELAKDKTLTSAEKNIFSRTNLAKYMRLMLAANKFKDIEIPTSQRSACSTDVKLALDIIDIKKTINDNISPVKLQEILQKDLIPGAIKSNCDNIRIFLDSFVKNIKNGILKDKLKKFSGDTANKIVRFELAVNFFKDAESKTINKCSSDAELILNIIKGLKVLEGKTELLKPSEEEFTELLNQLRTSNDWKNLFSKYADLYKAKTNRNFKEDFEAKIQGTALSAEVDNNYMNKIYDIYINFDNQNKRLMRNAIIK